MKPDKSISKAKTSNQLHQINFRVHRIDQSVRTPDWYIVKTDRPYTVFWYVISGEKFIKINNTEYKVGQGDFVVFPSQTPFEIIESDNFSQLHHFELAIENKLGPFDVTTLYKFPIVTKLTDSVKVDKLVELWVQLRNEWVTQREIFFPARNENFASELKETIDLFRFNAMTLDWFAEVLLMISPEVTELFPMLDARFQHLFYFIDDNLSEKLTLKKLADEVYLSESHLSLLFRKNIKIAPMEYVRKMRLQKARELLLTTTLQLKEVAEQIGFENQSQLSRAFRRYVGVSPGSYRRNGDFI